MHDNQMPFYTVIISAFNAEKTLSKTLQSVLEQTYTNYELILINDCSTDNTKSIIEEYKDKFKNIIVKHNEKNIGVANSRNYGISIAKGNYIAFLDSDDTWYTEKLQKQKDCIDRTLCDICCTSYDFVDSKYRPIRKPYITSIYIDYIALLKENFIGCSTVAIRKDLLQNMNYDSVFYHEDYALWLQLIRKGAKVRGVLDILMQYRVSRTSRSYNKLNSAIHRLHIYLEQENLGVIRSVFYFFIYVFNGLRKHIL